MTIRKDNSKSTACIDWELMLTEAMDGLLSPADEMQFNAHRTVCAECDGLYEEARRGREWLGFLAEEPAIPEGLLERLIQNTGPMATGSNAAMVGVPGYGRLKQMPPVWQRPGFMARAGRVAATYFEPRIMLTAAMAFFSIALTLNLAGFRLDRMHMGWIRPAAVQSIMERRITAASTPIVRLYDRVRDSYEVDSSVRAIQQTTEKLTAPLKNDSNQNQNAPENFVPQHSQDQEKSPDSNQEKPKNPNDHGAELKLPGEKLKQVSEVTSDKPAWETDEQAKPSNENQNTLHPLVSQLSAHENGTSKIESLTALKLPHSPVAALPRERNDSWIA